jgi:putative hemolysin
MTPFSLPVRTPVSSLPDAIWSAVRPTLESALGLATLDTLYARRSSEDFLGEALALLGVTVEASAADVAQIPAAGPVVVVANHPTGALDGLVLASVVRRVRPDLRLLGNHLLHRIPEMQPWTIAVDPFAAGTMTSARGLRAARRWLQTGGTLIVFPAGEVSSVRHPDGGLSDCPWQAGVVRLIDWTSATVVPVFINARPSGLFRWAARLHPVLRTLLLPRELLGQRGTRQAVAVGAPIPSSRVLRLPGPDASLAYLRARTYGLRRDAPASGRWAWRVRNRRPQPTADAEPARAVADDIRALPSTALLLHHGEYDVYCARAADIPAVLREIGRLRELTFRAAGEGTGLARDLDRFDDEYLHLFVWQRERRDIVGAYRLGLTDQLMAAHGVGGLYTRTLFHFGPRLLRQIGPAIELGRSFVRPEYQREPAALFLLWKGIGQIVVRDPRYRRLFGPVSISAEYRSFTRQLLARFLSSSGFASELASLVRARRPLRPELEASMLVRTTVAADLDSVEALVQEIEAGRGIPVLLRHYLKLNARLLGFSVDPEFGNVLDGLVLVDLMDVRPAVLQRYLGRDGAAAFRAAHHVRESPALTVAQAAG